MKNETSGAGTVRHWEDNAKQVTHTPGRNGFAFVVRQSQLVSSDGRVIGDGHDFRVYTLDGKFVAEVATKRAGEMLVELLNLAQDAAYTMNGLAEGTLFDLDDRRDRLGVKRLSNSLRSVIKKMAAS
jgi:hypothetical protein